MSVSLSLFLSFFEHRGKLTEARNHSRPPPAAQRTAALRHDDDLQATLLPLLLRNYLEHGLYEQADRLVSKTQFPEGTAQNNQLARWYYYLGAFGTRWMVKLETGGT